MRRPHRLKPQLRGIDPEHSAPSSVSLAEVGAIRIGDRPAELATTQQWAGLS